MAILHPSRSLTALVPRYVSRFGCIGASCEDSCCAGWQIAIDKKTFDAYHQATHPELKPVFAASVKRRDSGATDAYYARIELEAETTACPLMQERLCSVQKHLDESHLSDTCFNYPRTTRQFAGGVEQSLTLSCPEAARQALLQADAFDFVEHRIQLRDASALAIGAVHGLDVEAMNDIRIFCFQMMRTEGLALWEKLALLGVFSESLSKAIAARKQDTIPALVNQCIGILESGALRGALQGMQPNHAIQASLFAALWTASSETPRSPAQRAVIDTIAARMEAGAADGASSLERIIAHYRRGIERLPEALAQAPYLLEHYVLNEMFSNLFPFGDMTPYENYRRLVSRFGMVRFVLAMQCSGDDLPTLEQLAQTVQVFCRRIQHDASFATTTGEALRNRGYDKLEEIYTFLRY